MAGGVAFAKPEAEGPWPLPEGWCWVTIGDVVDPVGTTDPKRDLGEKKFHYIDLSALKDGHIANAQLISGLEAPSRARQVAQAGDTLFSCVRVYLQNIALLGTGFKNPVASTAYCVMRPGPAVEPRYLNFFVRSRRFIEWMIPLQRGNSPPAVLDADVKAQPFPLPPLTEQHRIVARIDALFAEIAEGEAALAAARKGLETFRRALLKAAVTGELTKDWRTQNPTVGTKQESGHDLLARIKMKRSIASTGKRRGKRNDASAIVLDITTLPQLPEGWAWGTIDDIAIDTLIGLDRGAASQRPEPVGCPYIKMQNISVEGKVDLSNLVYVDADAEETSKYAIMDGDVLFNTRNSKELVGKTGIVNHPAPGTIFNNNLMRIRSIDRSTNQWLAVALVSPPFLERLEMIKKATTSVAAIYASDLFTLPIPIPPPAETDEILRRISKALSASADTLAVLDAEAADAARLKQSILKAAFEGRLVPQDPADEPASALLARLSAPAPEARRGRGARTRAK
ncbi:MAG: hypothetical protein EWM45_11730 [Rhodopseudomonas palustris]|nr:MAG: hypothetical protein EWM45_11730 [Rhodopseudomonas palustris]